MGIKDIAVNGIMKLLGGQEYKIFMGYLRMIDITAMLMPKTI